MMRKLTEEQIARIYELNRRWEQYSPPCGIPYCDIWNPCLPEESSWEEDKGWLFCCTCGLKQRPELTCGTSH